MAAMGHIIGYVAGTIDLVAVFGPSFGDTQFKKLTLIAAFGLIFAAICNVQVWSWIARPPAAIAGIVTKFNEYKPDLLTAWMWATFLVALCGLPWALATWAPNTYLGIEVNRLSSTAPSHRRLSSSRIEMTSPSTPFKLEHGLLDDPVSSTGELSGLYFGILNIYTTIPQFIGTFISMIVFSILEPGKSPELAHDAHPDEHHGTDGPNAIAVCLFIGALSTIGAAFATKRLKDLQ
ncbi:hypothetical protein M7I_0238 [Glarea lozoyensis 74030]|uniref:Uncharacterized protein n=1 Tax=Glarea lozoyensis (strain ATCC 74030 / MF5533) TaxID=1104152 RepID=H0ECU3_GLAL7|nr:hypothetical protein M7I_0238 [Glarea lozoyensis 74030]